MKRLPAIAFGVLVAATIGAFFVTQALKVSDPAVYGNPEPTPMAFNPVHGRVASCRSSATGHPLINYRQTELTIQPSASGAVGVYIVRGADPEGSHVATISSGRSMSKNKTGTFVWNGRLSTGRIAPDGNYVFRIALFSQGKTIDLTNAPVQVITHPPDPRVLRVTVISSPAPGGSTTSGTGTSGTGTSGTTTATTTTATATTTTTNSSSTTPRAPAVIASPHTNVRIYYRYGPYRRAWIDIYRTDVPGKPQLVAKLRADPTGSWKNWNGEIDNRPAPPGTYLAGITAQNLACDQASWPVVMPPTRGTTPGAGVSVRYLSVTPTLTPTVSGSSATVTVDSPDVGFSWMLHRAGTSKVLEHGNGAAGNTRLAVPMPRHQAALYVLVVRAGTHSSAVPLIASKAGSDAANAHVLVVLPMLTWIGDSPVDDNGDGLVDTLSAGTAVQLDRPSVDGPPASVANDAALLNHLNSRHESYQLTTDVALAEGHGPSLDNRWGVVFPDGSEFLPAALTSSLTGFVKGGAHVLTLGAGNFQGTSEITGYPNDPQAAAPVLSKTDMFGAQRGPLTSTDGALITELQDDLNLFGGTLAFTGFKQYQPIEPPAGGRVSAAGVANGAAAIVAYPVGSGSVIQVGLPNFGASLTHNVDSQELLDSAWRVLSKR